MKKILVIDGNSIINRAYYGIRPLTTTSGKYTNAIYGMISIISKQLDFVKPDYAAVAFDVKHPTFRHKMYSEYKAGRHPTPEDLLSQFDDAKECLSLMGFKVLTLPGWEADDIQGTISKMSHSSEDTVSYILSGDRDLLQLIDDKVTVLLATNKDTLVMDEIAFKEKYGVNPSEFVDMKALMGDASDHIPGVAGIGEKTAQTLISSFSNLENIYENINDAKIKKGVREKLINGKDMAFLSRTLSRIDTEAPLNITLDDIVYKGFDKQGLYRKFRELELNSFITKFKLEENSQNQTESGKKGEEKSKSEGNIYADNKKSLSNIKNTEIDGENGSLSLTLNDYIEVEKNQILNDTGKRFAIEFSENGTLFISNGKNNFQYRHDIKDLSSLFENAEVICYGGKSLLHKLQGSDIPCDSIKLLDLELYEYVLNPGSGNAGVYSLCSMFLGYAPASDVPCSAIMPALEKVMREKVVSDGLEKILFELELPLINVLTEIESTGFKIDVDGINEFSEALKNLADELANSIYRQAGTEFNLNSPKQLGEILFDKMGLISPKKKGKNGYSTDAETLESLRSQSPVIDDILEYRQVTKLKSTYTTALTEVADENHRLHTDFKQALTATGRLSSADPNLQNIPIRTKMGREMRRFFISKEGYSLVDADYSQIELRLLAHISDDYNMQEAFRNNEDIHRKTASAVFGVPEEFVDDEMRKRAKAVNFGIVYGISGFSLSKDIGSTVAEASKYIKNYMMNYPFIDGYLKQAVENATIKGYTKTPMGRRRYIPELKSPKAVLRAFGKRVAMNAPIQGAAADIMKLSMINVNRELKKANIDAKIVMQVHDELIIEVKDENVEICKKIVKCEMENAVKLSVPLTVQVTSGKNWLEQK